MRAKSDHEDLAPVLAHTVPHCSVQQRAAERTNTNGAEHQAQPGCCAPRFIDEHWQANGKEPVRDEVGGTEHDRHCQQNAGSGDECEPLPNRFDVGLTRSVVRSNLRRWRQEEHSSGRNQKTEGGNPEQVHRALPGNEHSGDNGPKHAGDMAENFERGIHLFRSQAGLFLEAGQKHATGSNPGDIQHGTKENQDEDERVVERIEVIQCRDRGDGHGRDDIRNDAHTATTQAINKWPTDHRAQRHGQGSSNTGKTGSAGATSGIQHEPGDGDHRHGIAQLGYSGSGKKPDNG